ncbi:MAG TPA: ABC transporter permease subunit [Planktothrix sp.]
MKGTKQYIWNTGLIVTAAGVWQLCAHVLGPSRLPDILQVGSALVNSFQQDPIIAAQGGGSHGYSVHILATMRNFLCGMVPGSLAGFTLAMVMSRSRIIYSFCEPIVEFVRTLPPLLVVPFAVLLVQSGCALVAVTVGIYSGLMTCIYTLDAIGNVPDNYRYLAGLLGAGSLRVMKDIEIPALLPELTGGLRVTAALGLGICIVTEYMAAPDGIGRVMKFALSYASVELILVGVIWVVVLSLLTDAAISLCFRSANSWSRAQAN